MIFSRPVSVCLSKAIQLGKFGLFWSCVGAVSALSLHCRKRIYIIFFSEIFSGKLFYKTPESTGWMSNSSNLTSFQTIWDVLLQIQSAPKVRKFRTVVILVIEILSFTTPNQQKGPNQSREGA